MVHVWSINSGERFQGHHGPLVCIYASYGAFFLINDTAAKFTCQDAGRHCWLSCFRKHESTEYRDPVLLVLYRELVRQIPRKKEYRKGNRTISYGFPCTSKAK